MYGTENKITINMDGQNVVNLVSSEQRFSENVFYGTRYIYQADVQDDAAAAIDLTSYQFRFSLSNVYDHTSPIANLVESDDSKFNLVGDRSDLDLGTGKISFRADFYTPEMSAAFDSENDGNEGCKGEIWGLPPGETNFILIAQWYVNVLNTLSSVAGDPPDTGLTYIVVGDLNGRIEQGIVLTIDADGKMVVTVDGVERGSI